MVGAFLPLSLRPAASSVESERPGEGAFRRIIHSQGALGIRGKCVMKLPRFRPRFRFSLRAMLVGLTLVGCVLGWLMLKRSEARREREAAEALRNLNAMVFYDFEVDQTGVSAQPTPPGPRWLTALLGENLFAHVHGVSFPYVEGVLTTQPYRLDRRDLGDKDLALVARFKHLETLYLNGFPIHSAALAGIERLVDLKDLSMASTAIDDEALRHVAKVSGLERLVVVDTKITSDGLRYLAPLSQLRELHLDSTLVSDDGLAHLAKLPSLRTLNLDNQGKSTYRTQITDRGLRHLKALPNLEELSLAGTDVSDAGLKELPGLKRLKYLSVYDTQVSAQAARKLEAALPGLKVFTQRPTR